MINRVRRPDARRRSDLRATSSKRVRVRTAELERANAALHAEIVERTHMAGPANQRGDGAQAMDASTESALLLDTRGNILAANKTAAERLGSTVWNNPPVGTLLFDHFVSDVPPVEKAICKPYSQRYRWIYLMSAPPGLTTTTSTLFSMQEARSSGWPSLASDITARSARAGGAGRKRGEVPAALPEHGGRLRALRVAR